MGVPTSEVGYTSATTGRGDHEVHKVHVVALDKKQRKLPKVFYWAAEWGYSGLDGSQHGV
jgi:hypothetical protein